MEKRKLIETLENIIKQVRSIPDAESVEVNNQFGDVVETAEVLQDHVGKWYLELGEVCQDN